MLSPISTRHFGLRSPPSVFCHPPHQYSISCFLFSLVIGVLLSILEKRLSISSSATTSAAHHNNLYRFRFFFLFSIKLNLVVRNSIVIFGTTTTYATYFKKYKMPALSPVP
ncbi:hypothetical protein Pfo_000376 [Paulownia fortunei]|nr:hypothetical protein Pfo_000376 [Paulownia fortunei]